MRVHARHFLNFVTLRNREVAYVIALTTAIASMVKPNREALKELLAATLAVTGVGLWTDVLTIEQAGQIVDIAFDYFPSCSNWGLPSFYTPILRPITTMTVNPQTAAVALVIGFLMFWFSIQIWVN